MRNLSKKSFALIGILALLCGTRALAQTTVPADIQAQIKARTEQLQKVNQELQLTQGQLNVVQNQKNTLQNQVKTLDTSIKQLNLNIRSDQLTTENLADEIGSLQNNLEDIGEGINERKQAIASTLQELQRGDGVPFVIMLLNSRSLAEGLSDAHSLSSLRGQLSEDIDTLTQLSDQYNGTLSNVSAKKEAVAAKVENLKSRKEIVEDEKAARAALLKETQSKEAVYQQKVSALKAQQDKLDNEIAQIEAQLRANLNPNVLPTGQVGLFGWPLANIRVTQHFGEQSYLYRGKPHNGTDFRTPVGTPVFAAADGTITAVANNDKSATLKYQYGRHVMIQHGSNLSTLYAHLSRQVVVVGQSVTRGQLIGYSGSTGYSTGPHLHFGVYYTPSVEFKSLPPAAGLVPVGVVLNGESYLPRL
jgi:murein DD-endopeptidase MepM/ murein hydrolase activator NlpD